MRGKKNKGNEPQNLSIGNDLALPTGLMQDLHGLIRESRSEAAQYVNAAITALYWQIGSRLKGEVLMCQRAEYGERLIMAAGAVLELEYGRGFSSKSLRHMVRFVDAFPEQATVAGLMRHLSWTHFLAIAYLGDPLKRAFYAEMCKLERWSSRALQERIQSMLYERTAISKNPEAQIAQQISELREKGKLAPEMVFRDPYVLGFLGLKDVYSEKDFENALLREMESFLLELGAGFAFLERQKRIVIDNEDFHIDLLFFHRKLRRLIAVELKIGDFRAADAGQVELYLRWLDKHERQAGEEPPIGLILCAGKRRETVELLELPNKGIHLAGFLIGLPPREILEAKLHQAIQRARLTSGQAVGNPGNESAA